MKKITILILGLFLTCISLPNHLSAQEVVVDLNKLESQYAINIHFMGIALDYALKSGEDIKPSMLVMYDKLPKELNKETNVKQCIRILNLMILLEQKTIKDPKSSLELSGQCLVIIALLEKYNSK